VDFAADGAEDLLHGLAGAQHAAQPLAALHARAQLLDLALQVPALEQLAHLHAQRLHLEGLGQVVGGAALHGLHRGGDGRGAGQHDHGRRPGHALELGQQLEAAAPGHDQVEQHEVGRRRRQGAQRLVDAGGEHHLALVPQDQAQRLADAPLVVHHENPRHAAQSLACPARAEAPPARPPATRAGRRR
jgi:hypothetical protein